MTAHGVSTTPGSKPNLDAQKVNQRNISNFQIFNHGQASQVAQFGVENEVYPNQTFASGGANNQSSDSAFQNYYQSAQQRTPHARNHGLANSGRNSFQNASEGIVSGGQPARQHSTPSS